MIKEKDLKWFGQNIQRVIEKSHLSRQESYEMFRQMLLDLQPDLQQGAFLSALRSKGETPYEIAGAWQAIVEIDTNCVNEEFAHPLVENSGTGMDRLKTFNVSSAAAVVAAAAGVRLARHGSRGLTSSCGTVDLLEALGIDVECDVEAVSASIRQTGIGLFNGMSAKVHPRSLARILGQIRFGSTFNIAASLASPCRPTHALRGVYSKEAIPGVSRVMREVGYQRAMIVHGLDIEKTRGMDELSTIGETIIHEFYSDEREENYTLAPEDVGLRRVEYDSIAATGNLREESVRFLRVIGGTAHPECQDITCLNAGAILYLIGEAEDIQRGFEKGREIIGSGSALEKLAEWVSVQTDPMKEGVKRFLSLAREAGLKKRVSSLL